MRIALASVLIAACSGAPASSYIEPNARPPFKVVELAIGGQHACARLDDGSVWCWGDNRSGQGSSLAATSWPLTARRVDGLPTASAIAAHGDRTCAVAAGAVFCFGNNDDSAFGVPSDATCSKTPCVTTPRAVPGIEDALAIAMGGYGICMLRSDHTIWCLRRIDQQPYEFQLRAEATVEGAFALAVGAAHLCAIRGDRRVVCWGSNSLGALGVDGVSASSDPIVVPAVEDAVAIAAGADNACALAEEGTLTCWGAVDGTPIDGASLPYCSSAARCTRTPIVAPGGPYASITMTGYFFGGYTYADTYRGVTTSCATPRGGDVTCRGREVDLNEARQPGSPAPVRVGTEAACGVVNERVHCWGRTTFLGGNGGPVRFPE